MKHLKAVQLKAEPIQYYLNWTVSSGVFKSSEHVSDDIGTDGIKTGSK